MAQTSPDRQWRKSSRSNGVGSNGDCVEVAFVDTGIAVRDSKNPSGPIMTVAESTWKAFLDRA